MIPQQDDEPGTSLFPSQEVAAASDIRSAIDHFWAIVHKSADVIVTLRQENTVLQSNLAVRQAAEEELLMRIDQLLFRVEELENERDRLLDQPTVDPDQSAQIETLRTQVRELSEHLESARAHQKAHGLEREALEHRLLELERSATIVEASSDELMALRDEVASLQEQLEKALAIVERYRSAGLRHLEDPETEHQMALFGAGATRQLMTEEELTVLARRLDALADRVSELLQIS